MRRTKHGEGAGGHGTRGRVGMFGRLLRNVMNTTDIDRVKAKLLIECCLGWAAKGAFCWPPTLKGPKQVHSVYPILEKFKGQKAETALRNPTSSRLG